MKKVGTLGTIVILFFLFFPLFPTEVEKLVPVQENLTFQIVEDAKIIESLGIFWTKDFKAQIVIKNTDSESGTFTINFIFNRGQETQTITKQISISPGVTVSVTTGLPFLWGEGTRVVANVIPDTKTIYKTERVKESVSLANILGVIKSVV